MKIRHILLLLFVTLLASCKHSTPLIPVSTQLEGEMGQYLNIVDTESPYTIVSSDSATMKVTLHCNNMMPVDINFKLSVKFLDENDKEIASADNILSDETRKSIANMSEGETSTFTLQNLPDIPEDKNPAKFILSSRLTSHCILTEGTYTLKGNIGQEPKLQAITMTLKVDSAGVNGNYYYDRRGKGSTARLAGQYISHDETLNLNDTVNPQEINSFRGNLSADTLYTGTFIDNTTGLAAPFRLVLARDENATPTSTFKAKSASKPKKKPVKKGEE